MFATRDWSFGNAVNLWFIIDFNNSRRIIVFGDSFIKLMISVSIWEERLRALIKALYLYTRFSFVGETAKSDSHIDLLLVLPGLGTRKIRKIWEIWTEGLSTQENVFLFEL